MARKSHNKRHRGRGRRHRGGADPLNAGAYPKADMDGGKWNTSVSNSPSAAAANAFRSPLSSLKGSPMDNAVAFNKIALNGVGFSGSGGYGGQRGGSRRKRHSKGTRRRRGGADLEGLSKMMESLMGGKAAAAGTAAPAAATSGAAKLPAPAAPAAKVMAPAAPPARAQGGGMFASFGALLKEALVPLGLLAAQQTYGKRYSKKHRSSGSHTRKHRR